MTIRVTTLGGTDFTDGEVLYGADLSDTVKKIGYVPLGSIIQHDLSATGAATLAECRTAGFALCDGTTPASQGVTSPIITTTRNLVGLFIRGHGTASGGTGGAATINIAHTHNQTGVNYQVANAGTTKYAVQDQATGSSLSASQSILPPYFEVVFLQRVK